MKKVFKLMALALVAGAMMVACGDPNEDPNNNVNQEQPGEPVLLEEGFDVDGIPAGWATADRDGDGYNWMNSISVLGEGNGANGSAGMMLSQSYVNNLGALEPDNWLITPAIQIPNNKYSISWNVRAQDNNDTHEYYEVHVGTMNGGNFTSTARIFSGYADDAAKATAWVSHNASLADFAGQTVYIAFRHCNTTDMYFLDLDDVKVYDNTL